MHGYRDAADKDARDHVAEAGNVREERTRRNATLLIRGAKSVGLASLAEATGVSDSTISRWLEKPEAIGALIACMGYKLVPAHVRCYEPKFIDALLTFAQPQLAKMKSADDLDWDEDTE